ncbi:MAG: Hsp20/alpha crystallin family protein [Chloroflexi bacterium]|nr:Hsp20/alpha crystallin family protein [Chloroflexota bacterium]
MAATNVPVKAEETKPARRQLFDMTDLMEEMERLWERAWTRPMLRTARPVLAPITEWAPKMDVFEKNGNVVIKTELPGVNKEDLDISLEQGDLIIKGVRKQESEVKEENYYRMERSYGSFFRRLPLGFETDPAKISAQYKDGVLEVQIPRPAEAKPETQKIQVS